MKEIVKDVYVVKDHSPGDMNCCIYMVDTKSDDGLILIDAGLYIEPIQSIENDGFDVKDIKHCLITHGHIDHFGACCELKKLNKNIEFYAHELDAERIEQTPKDKYIQQFFPNYNYDPIKLTSKIKIDREILKFGRFEFECIYIPGHTPGSIAYFLEAEQKKILFGGDVPGVVLRASGGNIGDYTRSMEKLLDLNIDILCEGHAGIIKPAGKISDVVKAYVRFNENLHIVAEVDPSDTKALLDLTLVAYELEWYENALDFCNYLLEIDPNNTEAQRLLKEIKKHNPPIYEFIKGLIKENFGKNG
ncbi:MAG: MBL fold metallo-hydrolase [Candidatus Bathyarchaeota archaeon]|nr:MBL fold metallo-hydrolase [Candidatus Bathyarchaeota archaeon]